ncbi:MAG: nuclear transport factor 2 family protein, partial [Bacteroidota bacterium]
MKEIYQQTLDKWHRCMQEGDMKLLDEILAEEVVFYSPVVWTPQRGKAITSLYLHGAKHVLGAGGFHYTRKVLMDNQFVLEFSTQIDEVTVEGVDIVRLD